MTDSVGDRSSRFKAGLAVILIVLAASCGILARFLIPGSVGQFLYVLTRLGMLILPFLWFVRIEHGKFSLSLPTQQQWFVGGMLGLLMAGLILSAYGWVGQSWIDPAYVQAQAKRVGLANPAVYWGSAVYFTLINSLIEEYIWRWFIGRQWVVLLPKAGAVAMAALCFTCHHIIALTFYTGNGLIVLLGSLGVFVAGAVWTWCYLTYRSLWSCYISHVLADLAIAVIGGFILFDVK